jgi:hypothetical protein
MRRQSAQLSQDALNSRAVEERAHLGAQCFLLSSKTKVHLASKHNQRIDICRSAGCYVAIRLSERYFVSR